MSDAADDLELRSYGRRRGRKPSPRQEVLLKDLLPRVAVDIAEPLRRTQSGCLPAGQPASATQFWLEIGFGGGEHLLWQAQHNRGALLIGCEPFEDGVIKVLTAIDRDKLENIRLYMGDARDVLRALPEASIARAFILFPDPWPKRKHQKRRLINPHLLDMLARVMKAGGELRFATDIGDYARTALLAFRAEPRFRWLAERPQDWRDRPDDWPQTRYEAKAIREGRVRYFFRFIRLKDT